MKARVSGGLRPGRRVGIPSAPPSLKGMVASESSGSPKIIQSRLKSHHSAKLIHRANHLRCLPWSDGTPCMIDGIAPVSQNRQPRDHFFLVPEVFREDLVPIPPVSDDQTIVRK